MPPPERAPRPDGAYVTADAFLAVLGKRQGPLKGECETAGHEDEIDLIAWRWAVSAPTAAGSARATGRRVYELLRVDKYVDASSTKLINALASNEELRSVTLSLRKAGTDDDDFFSVKLERARVVGSELQSSPSGGLYETVAFAYQKIQIDYHPQQRTGQRGAATSFSDELEEDA
jgi:type VI secretion system secreted protein Hcp